MEGEPNFSRTLDPQYTFTVHLPAIFNVGLSTPRNSVTFRSYGYYKRSSRKWSMPSDPMEIQVSETIGKPTLKAHPGFVITRGMQVTMSCEGTSSAQEYYLCKEGSPDPWQRQRSMVPGNKAEFFFPSIQQNHAGRYHCYYQTHVGWSENSDSLDLMVTGLYRKPRLSVLSSPVVRLGENVTLQCVSQLGYDGFVLTKEESQKLSLIWDSQYIYSNGQFRALFSVGLVTSRQRRTFRCYGYFLSKPQVWSEPSDPQELLVSASQSQDHMMENLIRMCLSGLILTVLGILLFDACCSQRRMLKAAYK
uniref:leukocyte immunoglobulin-like receptor subfamily A member 5 n=1 Tax=Arvicanthis niloticus TaxID=61156 RepID=UPI00148756DC|nr:leukocyte immunoglobulin-like receptor subfamily A member 5 [Arvicanthis niloticus]